MKKILGILACLLVIAGLAGYFVLIPQLEEKQAAQVASFLERLPGTLKADSIKVRLLDNTIEVLGLKGDTKYVDGSDMNVDVGSITVTGVNFTPGAGVVTLVDAAEMRDAKLRISTKMPSMGQELPPELDKPIVQNLTIGAMTLKSLRGDYAGLAAAIAADSRKDIFACLGSTFVVAETVVTEYANQVDSIAGPVNMSLASMSAKDVGLLKCGPSVCESLAISMFGSEVMRISSMSLASCTIPNVYPALIDAQESGDLDAVSEALFSGKEGEALSVRGLEVKDVSFKLMLPEPLSIGNIRMDFLLDGNKLVLKHDMAEMIIPESMYRNLGMEAAQFADFYGRPLNISTGADVDLRWEPGKADLNFTRLFIEDKELGAASLAAVLYATGEGDTVEEFTDGSPEPYLVKLDLMLEDKALLSNLFGGEFEAIKAFGLAGEGMESAEDLRRQAVSVFEAEVAGFVSADQKAVGEGLIKLLKAPGKLTVSLNPESPVPLDGIEHGRQALNAGVEYTPAEAAEPASPATE